jgi:hypothetical protein
MCYNHNSFPATSMLHARRKRCHERPASAREPPTATPRPAPLEAKSAEPQERPPRATSHHAVAPAPARAAAEGGFLDDALLGCAFDLMVLATAATIAGAFAFVASDSNPGAPPPTTYVVGGFTFLQKTTLSVHVVAPPTSTPAESRSHRQSSR